MTRAEFHQKWRGPMLLFVTDAWAIRHEKPSDLGLTLEQHMRRLHQMREDIYTDLSPKPKPPTSAVSDPDPERTRP